MKYEIKTSKVTIKGVGIVCERYYNTPLSCVFIDRDKGICHYGLNLTDDGEFIPAPGFDSCVSISREAALIIFDNMMSVRGSDLLSEDFDAALSDLGWQLGEEVTPPNAQGDVQG